MTRRALIPAVLLLFVAACMLPAKDNNKNGSPSPSSPSATGTGQPEGTTTFEEFTVDIQGSVQSVQDYWTQAFQASNLAFQPISQVVAYQREGEQNCGGNPVPLNNALYCPQGDFIAYDIRWAYDSFRTIGDAFIYFLIGHEYGHGIQARLGITHQFSIDQELQADCLSGAYLGDSVRSKEITLDPNGRDLQEFQQGLAAVADDPNQPWFAAGSHGSAQQRTTAFFDGYQQSLTACGLS
jgi:predicted metalloprotease